MAGPLIASELARQFLISLAASGSIAAGQEIFADNEIVPALEVINNTLTRIDQALVDGFNGYDPQMRRSEAAFSSMQSVAQAIGELERQLLEAQQAAEVTGRGRDNRALTELRERVAWGERTPLDTDETQRLQVNIQHMQDLWRQLEGIASQRVSEDSIRRIGLLSDNLTELERQLLTFQHGGQDSRSTSATLDARRAEIAGLSPELVSGVSPVSGVGAGAVGVGAIGANPNPNACCCVHEQVMGAVNKGLAAIPEDSPTKQLMDVAVGGEKGKEALENLISPEAKANLDEFSAKFSDIFVQASRDGKITAGEIGNSFKQMAMQILEDQVFSKLFAQAGPLGQIAGNLLGGLLVSIDHVLTNCCSEELGSLIRLSGFPMNKDNQCSYNANYY